MSFDGHPTDFRSGQLRGGPRNWSAASKESLHLILLAKTLQGDRTAEKLLTPDPKHPEAAIPVALDVLKRKIASYEAFHRQFPGFGGFLPWYRVDGDKVVPTDDWRNRVPGLDNGQLAWSLYYTAHALDKAGQAALAERYRAHLKLMADNVVPIFYDPTAGKLRAEATLLRGSSVPTSANQYATTKKGYYLDDAYEGLLLNHFADLMGVWSRAPGGKEAIWQNPHRQPAVYQKLDQPLTLVKGYWMSSHEDWGFLVLPYRDVPVANALFENEQKVRTGWSAMHGWPSLFASTTTPTSRNSFRLHYSSALGVPGATTQRVSKELIFAPYATFPLALVDKRIFATWLKSTLERSPPGTWGPYGMGDSFTMDGRRGPLLTWDGKALPVIAWMGGITSEIRESLKQDGLYDRFLSRVDGDYRLFNHKPLLGVNLALSPPTM